MNLKIQIAYANQAGVHLIDAEVNSGCNALQAIQQSGILENFPDIDIYHNKVGIYGSLIDLQTMIAAGDRIEIYEAVLIDPKEARRHRAKSSAGNDGAGND